MSKRDDLGRYAKSRSPWFIALTWLAGVLSLGLVYVTGAAVMANFAAMRSCDANNNGLKVVNCGKQALNVTDTIMIGLFILSALLVVTLFTAGWRMMRRRS